MKTTIPSPLPFLTQLPDKRNPQRITFHQHTFWQLTMTALLAGCGNVLEITQWIHDQREVLIEHLEIRTVNGKAVILSQASVYWGYPCFVDSSSLKPLGFARTRLDS